MLPTDTVWSRFVDWLSSIDAQLPQNWPAELPPESDPQFWWTAVRLEMSGRKALSAKLRSLVETGELPAMTDVDVWMYRRRVEWAGQLAVLKMQAGVEPDAPLPQVLTWALIDTWESDGCVGLWNHAERGGKAPAEPLTDLFSP